MLRTHHCGELREENIDQVVTLAGWVQEVRDKGYLLWIDLRDWYGVTQVILSKDSASPNLLAIARKLGREYVIRVTGKVIARSAVNKHIPTGGIEIVPTAIEVLNSSATPPFLITDKTDAQEELRMKYRYLDLRRRPLQQNILLRSAIMQGLRRYLEGARFIELETPLLVKSTPEGARDFVVPARQSAGEYYALPQSPQLLKQLLMIATVDRYFQFSKCFRDEDLRADRQPEFTQLDLELAFVTQADVISFVEGAICHLFKEVKGLTLPPFAKMSYAEAMALYGTDKPDLRWDMPFIDFTKHAKGYGFPPFEESTLIIGIKLNGAAKDYSRNKREALQDWLKANHPQANGILYIKCEGEGRFDSSAPRWYEDAPLQAWGRLAKAQSGDLLLLIGGAPKVARNAMDELRRLVIERDQIPAQQTFAPLWVVDFPLLEWEEATQRYSACHHPFTRPKAEDEHLLSSDPASVRAQSYDLVINGLEVGGGSIRIHEVALQSAIFKLLGISEEVAQEQFGFFLEALTYGAPPHGGFALGLDRFCSLLGRNSAIRDYILFPKNNHGRDTMMGAPSALDGELFALSS